jgi:hypothetical protein
MPVLPSQSNKFPRKGSSFRGFVSGDTAMATSVMVINCIGRTPGGTLTWTLPRTLNCTQARKFVGLRWKDWHKRVRWTVDEVVDHIEERHVIEIE